MTSCPGCGNDCTFCGTPQRPVRGSLAEQVAEVLGAVGQYATEFSPEFALAMVRRMQTSLHKYGPLAKAYPQKINAIETLLLCLTAYAGMDVVAEAWDNVASKSNHEGTKDLRRLVDVANYAMIEFMHPRLEGAHNPENEDRSAGRAWSTGVVSEESNTPSYDNIRRGGTRGKTSGGHYRREGD